MKNFAEYGVQIPEILLPKNVDLKSWSVIACDQYTQDKEYWKKAAESAGSNPSTLNLIFPEVYLNEPDEDSRIKKIHETMKSYLDSDIFTASEECIYIERKTEYGRTRRGLVVAVDLEKYEWKPGSKALIRATEATVPERIPPRMKIRTGASLELPHIMLLTNDPKDLLVGGAASLAKKGNPVYDGDLMCNSGHITGWAVKGEEAEDLLQKALSTLAKDGTDSEGNCFLFAVGDGNHSLATAKAVWDEHKKSLSGAELESSPVRYALVEIVNIYDEGLTFEPIHRVIFNQDAGSLILFIEEKLEGEIKSFDSEKALEDFVSDKNAKGARYGFITTVGGKEKLCALQTEITDLAIAALQPVLDEYLDEHSKDKKNDIDYIHGTEDVVKLGKQENALSILLPPIAKDSFFATINGRGVLPRKSFSMGEASEKRFYVEARRLF
ncbi:DUF1015 domain-containing protein [uncultured Treponema sp.]|uniref:DUF1015 domain-containing protein n=1 Tax=uncultured Treponema sp. TaxID=162155 RepID=UPI0025DBCF61|nr:DUF1015 domain-containing protein [uncultured Treponema sp.]